MDKSKLIKYIFGLLFGISIYSLTNYIDSRHAISEGQPILYTIAEKRINKGGRGESYELIIKFQNKEHTISITSKEFDLIEDGRHPELYFSKYTGTIYSKWTITLS